MYEYWGQDVIFVHTTYYYWFGAAPACVDVFNNPAPYPHVHEGISAPALYTYMTQFAALRRIADTKRSTYLWMIFGIGLVIRVAAAFVLGDPSHPEMYEHGMIARHLYEGHGFTMHWPYAPLDPQKQALLETPPQYEGSWMPPLNPYIIYTAFVLLGGDTPVAAIALMLLNALCNAAIPVVVYLLALRMSSETEARISGIVAMLFLPSIYGVTTFSGLSLYQLALVVILLLHVRVLQRGRTTDFLLLGGMSAIMAFLRSEFLAIGAVMLLATGFLTWRKFHRRGTYLAATAGGLLVLALIVAPWMYRNYELFGKFIPIVTHSSHEIWRGNNELATGATYTADGRPIWPTPRVYPDIVRKIDSLPYNQHTEIAIDSIFREEVQTFVSEHPGRVVWLSVKKVLMLWSFDPYYPPARHPLYILTTVVFLVPFWIGFITYIRRCRARRDYNVLIVFLLFMLAYMGTFAITFVLPRYQTYFFTGLMPFTGIGWLLLFRWVTGRRRTAGT